MAQQGNKATQMSKNDKLSTQGADKGLGMESTSIQCCEWKEKYFELEARVARMQEEMNDLRSQVRKDRKEVRQHCKYFYKQNSAETAEIKELKEKVEILSNTVIRLDQQFQEANTKLLDMQARSMRKNLIISGIREPKNESPDQLKRAVATFIRETLQVNSDVQLKIVHRLNYIDNSEYRPVIIKVSTVDDKLMLLSHGSNLKGKVNDKNRYYYLNEQLPDKYAEDKRYAQLWIKENKAKPANDQSQMKIYKNKLRINNAPYNQKLKPPSTAEILRLDHDEILTVKQAPTVFGDSTMLECSEFISYAAKVTSVEQVRVAYRKLRIKYADATHIVSAYRLDPPNGPYNQEATDDGEHGGGRCLLNVLQENQITNMVVFIVRFFGGKHIGAARFDTMRQLARVALVKAGALNAFTDTANKSHPRCQTRSMTMGIRGRGRATPTTARIVSSADQQDISQRLQNIADGLTHNASMFRPTPVPSPHVSPERTLLDLVDRDLSDETGSHFSNSEDGDLQSAREEFNNNATAENCSTQASTNNSDADDEEEAE